MTKWDKRYKRGQHITDGPHPLVVRAAAALHPGRALDLASGMGRHSLWLAERGWQVTAVDNSPVAMENLRQRSAEKGVMINSYVADLEKHEFVIEPNSYDLIVVCNYLQRDLFLSIKEGTRPEGVVVAIIAMVDDDPNISPMNPAYVMHAGELRREFEAWELIHDYEGKPGGDQSRRRTAEIVARRR